MRTVNFILALLLCLGLVATAQQSSDVDPTTPSKKKATEATEATEASAGSTSDASKKKTTTTSTSSSSSSTTSSASLKSKPKSTKSSGNKTTGTGKETVAKEEETKRAPNPGASRLEKESGASKAEGGEKMSGATAATKTKTGTGDNEATPASNKATTGKDKSDEKEDGTDVRDPTKAGKKPAAVSSMTPEELEGFETYVPEVQQLIRRALELTTQNLRYQFGSADPKAGGMDCSGTKYRVLLDSGIKEAPRQSDEICRWVMRRTRLYRTEETSTLKDKSLSALKPGDLLFWSGTYETSNPRELPISHVMLYLGKRKKDGKPVVFGASDGRTYDGQRRNGVSVFDFVMPKRDGKAAFYGYGPIPGLKLTPGTTAGQ